MKRRETYGPIGIDIGAGCVKMIQFVQRQGQLVLVAWHHEPMPDAPDDSARTSAAASIIQKALRLKPFVGRKAACALGRNEFQMKNIRVPGMPEEELDKAVEFEARERFELGDAGAQFRYVTAGEVRHGNELKQELIVFAASDSVVQSRLDMLDSLKLEAVALDLAPCAVARSFFRFLKRAEDAAAVNVFLDVGLRGTAILVTRGTNLVFLKMIESGGLTLNESVAQALGLAGDQASELRLRIMQEHAGRRGDSSTGVSDDVQLSVRDASRPVAERICKDLQLCLRYHAVTFRGQRADGVTLVGGEAHDPTLKQLIGETVDLPCVVGYPLRGVAELGELTGREERTFHPAWAAACGLALRSPVPGKKGSPRAVQTA